METTNADREQMIRALKLQNDNIGQLCAMVNSYSAKLGLGKKVNADDWQDVSHILRHRKTA